MKDRKIRMKSNAETKAMAKSIRERLDLIDKDTSQELHRLDYIFAGTKDYPEEFHQLYVQPLLESGLTVEDSITLLVDGAVHPN